MSKRIQIDQSILLGEGTYGRVFKGLDTQTNLPVAIKRAKVEIRSASGGVHFTTIREIKIMRKLEHSNLMNLVDIFNEQDDQVVSLVMPFMETDLGSIFSDRSIIFTMAHVKGITKQILAGLEYMHSHWYVHRDLKPANVFVDTTTGTCKIGDFGFARTFATPHSGIHGRRRPFGGTMTPLVVTQWYRAPELFFGSTHYGAGVDIWAAGCIVCEMLPRQKANRRPLFEASSDTEQLSRIFELMGTPSDNVWPLGKTLPKFLLFTHLPPPSVAWPDTLFPGSCAAAVGTAEFIQSLLMIDPADRVGAGEALASEYLGTALPIAATNRLLANLFSTRMIK